VRSGKIVQFDAGRVHGHREESAVVRRLNSSAALENSIPFVVFPARAFPGVSMTRRRTKAMANWDHFFTNSASNAVLPCRKFFWPMGPISPLQKNPASQPP
jgi:hypothetical protein